MVFHVLSSPQNPAVSGIPVFPSRSSHPRKFSTGRGLGHLLWSVNYSPSSFLGKKWNVSKPVRNGGPGKSSTARYADPGSQAFPAVGASLLSEPDQVI